ncbi:flavoprotein [Actinospica robiniae]|uniref:flavoprotein n=1 Tax=Actinospica robiniae TaxID=304901 RepID=UPI00040FC2CF|nr:flavoprotein [Actinospica robiniae]
MTASRVLYVVACAAPPSEHVDRAVRNGLDAGFTVCVIATPSALQFIGDPEPLEELSGHPVYSRLDPGAPAGRPPAHALLACPLTFNTLNKWATGVNDNLAVGVLNEALGLGTPVTAVPWINGHLARHPAIPSHIDLLRAAGVTFTSGLGHPSSRHPEPNARPVEYPWGEVEAHIHRMFDLVTARST